jgi:hypothetical protein
VSLLELGMYAEPAAEACGISTTTFYRWRAEGEELAVARRVAAEQGGKAPTETALQTAQREFWEATEKAASRSEAAYLRQIAMAAAGGAKFTEVRRVIEHERGADGKITTRIVSQTETEKELLPTWTAAAWILERRQPDRWGRRERIEHSGPGGKPIETTVNAGRHAVENPQVSAAVDSLLDEAVGHHDSTEDRP